MDRRKLARELMEVAEELVAKELMTNKRSANKMDRERIARELVKVAKELVADDGFAKDMKKMKGRLKKLRSTVTNLQRDAEKLEDNKESQVLVERIGHLQTKLVQILWDMKKYR